jgi:hypothetical protein
VTARVFVPLVGATGASEQLFEAIAGDAPPEAHPARLLPQISELYDFGLYRPGQTVREAVMRFIAERAGHAWLGRRNATTVPWYLRISELQVGRLSDENARSAGFGLALAAILQAFGRDGGVVFATGELLLPEAPGVLKVAIGPVDGIAGKLALVGDYIVRHRAQLAGSRIVVALPRHSVDGVPLETAEARTLARLQADAAEAGAELQVVFADHLDDVEAAFGRFEVKSLVTPRRALAAGFAVAVVTLAVGGWYWLTHAPIGLDWVALDTDYPDGSSPSAEPQRARYDAATDAMTLLPPCFDDQRQPVVVGGEMLLLRVEARDPVPFASDLAPPRIFVASVSRAADPIILDAALFAGADAPVAADAAMFDSVLAVPVEAVEDEVRLFIVATRDPTLEASDAVADLNTRLEGLTGAAVLATTATFLQDRFDAQIDYQFRVTSDDRFCP